MQKLVFALILAFSALSLGHAEDVTPHLHSGAKVFIEPMNGFETYLAAAFLKKKVPLVIVDSRDSADYIMTGTSELDKASWAKTIFISPKAAAHASVSLKSKAGEMLYAYSVDKTNSARGEQSTAEACAKHIKEAIEKSDK